MSTEITVRDDRNRDDMLVARRFYGGAGDGPGRGVQVNVFCKDRETAMLHWGNRRCREGGSSRSYRTFKTWLREQEREGYQINYVPGGS